MTDHPDEDRNQDLKSALDDCNEYITSRLAVLFETTGQTADFHLIMSHEQMMETAGAITDFDKMADAFGDVVCHWVEEGHCTFDDSEYEDPLFTATFDPQKARPS